MSARRILQIIRFVSHQDRPISAKEIGEQLGMPRPSVYRLITSLEEEDVVQRSADNSGYELTSNFLRTMITGASKEQIIAGFEEALICTANTWGTAAFLGRLEGPQVEIVHVVTPMNAKNGYIHPGMNTRPAHACSAARAILASLSAKQIDEILNDDFTAFTDKTIVEEDLLRRELALTKERGYAVCDEEINIGITSIAAPIIVGRAGVVCSLGIVSLTQHMHDLGLEEVGTYLHAKAKGAIVSLNQNLFENIG